MPYSDYSKNRFPGEKDPDGLHFEKKIHITLQKGGVIVEKTNFIRRGIYNFPIGTVVEFLNSIDGETYTCPVEYCHESGSIIGVEDGNLEDYEI